ncbi:MAG: LptA/OstA family protein [Pseudomonadota bacterium]|nr:LptA/OstA family protein [Pseudomonadota bacterium]
MIRRANLAAALLVMLPGLATAQTINLASTNRDKPIEVFADNGIEWQQDNEVLIARGNARAVRSDVDINAEVLRAFYKKKPEGGTDLSRLDAAGKVRITSPNESIVGQAAVYDMENAVLLVSGKKVVYRSGSDVITANRQMEYYEIQQKAVARGDATAVHEGKTVRAETLVALIRKNAQGKTEVHEIQAFKNVAILTDKDTVLANRGVYNVISGIATLIGNVRITRGQNQLAGDKAEINVNTGISKLLTDHGPSSEVSGTKRKRRVRGLILPSRP